MSDYVYLKSGSHNPVIPGEFINGDGTPIDLSGKSVVFTMRPWNSASYIVNAQPASIIDAAMGKVVYNLSSGEAVAGHHLGMWTIDPAGDNLRLPVAGYVHILIDPSL